MSILRRYIIGVSTSLCLAGAVPAQSPAPGKAENDLLDQAKRIESVAAQKVESDIRQALIQAERVARKDSTKAIEQIQKVLAKLDEDTVLDAKRKQSLRHMLADRIRVIRSDAEAAIKQEGQAALVDQKRQDTARKDAEQAKLVRAVKDVNHLQEQGDTEKASKQAAELAGQNPKNATVSASSITADANDRAEQTKKARKDSEKGYLAASRDIERSAILPNGDIEFPKDWKERTKGRTASVKLSPKEKAILQALNTTVSVNFKNSKLEDVLEYFRTLTGQNLVVDSDALKDVEAAYDTPVTFKARSVSVRTALRKVLADVGLTYVIKDETIRAVSPERAKDMMVVRAYYIGDILANWSIVGGAIGAPAQQNPLPQNPRLGLGPFGGGVQVAPVPAAQAAAPQLQAIQNMQNVKAFIQMIENSVDSASWQTNGGRGTITFNPASLSLVIKQSAEVHAQIGGGGMLR
jgi:general secretion pathway protein D